MRKPSLRRTIVSSMREIVFGLEDSLVSTLGTITGIAAGTQSTYIVILSGLVLIAVEGTSMTAGSYLSSKSAYEAEAALGKDEGVPNLQKGAHPLHAAAIMGIFYLAGGFIPLAPYFFLPIQAALLPSILMTGVSLFALGVWSSKFTKRNAWRSGFEMLAISAVAALIGFVIGNFVQSKFDVKV